MKRICCSLLLFLLVFTAAKQSVAQGYENAIGLRLGTSQGITFKHALANDGMLELMLTSRWGGWNFTAMYQKYAPAFNADGLYWYYGAGAHIGFYDGNDNDKNPWYDEDDDEDHVIVGIDGIIGLEYQIGEIPFHVGLDWKPAFNLFDEAGLWADEVALSIRYVF
jgi:hypothetical protein